MLKMYGSLFFNEYIIKHHLARFLGSSVINREQPWYFYLIVLFWGFLPWIISVVSVLIRKIIKRDLKLTDLTIYRRFVLYNGIIFLFTLFFFSISGTKLITYILPLYPPLACLAGYIWTNYVERGEYSRVINKTVYIIGCIFTLAGLAAIFTQYYLPSQLNSDISGAKPLCVILVLFMGIGAIIFTKKRIYIGTFFVYVIFMACLSAFGTEKLFEVDYKFGQDELMKYAQYADEHNKSITCYQFDQKYSLIFYSNESVEYGDSFKINDLRRELNTPNNLVIIQRKDVTKQIAKLPFKIIYKGRKYWLIENR